MDEILVQQYLGKFTLELKVRKRQPPTIFSYSRAVARLLRKVTKKPVEDLTTDDLKAYQVWLNEKAKLDSASVNLEMVAVKQFFRWVFKSDVADGVPRMKENKKQVEFFTEEEMSQILNAIDNKKHRLEIMVCYDCGLRIGELTRIRVADIDFVNNIIHIRKGKGQKDGRVSFSEYTKAAMREYIDYNHVGQIAYLFAGQAQGTHIDKRSVQNVLHNACEKANIRGRHNVHKLRHSYGTQHILNGTDVSMVQQLMRHTNIKTTLGYVHVANKALKVETPLAALMRKIDTDNRELHASCGV